MGRRASAIGSFVPRIDYGPPSMTEPTRISPAEAHARMQDEGYTYVDVRTPEEFAEGRPEGSVNVPFLIQGEGGLVPNPAFLDRMAKLFAKQAKLVVGCKAGGRSLKAAKALLEAGYANVLDQRAGWDGSRSAFGELTEPGWSRVGLPTAG